MTETIARWRSVYDFPRYQIHDGNAHFTYYCPLRQLSFIWDGKAEWIEVSHGGYGEHVEWIIPAFVYSGTPGECLNAFEKYCFDSLDEWDNTIWNDNDFTYCELYNPKCAIADKLKPIPKGRPYSKGYNQERGIA